MIGSCGFTAIFRSVTGEGPRLRASRLNDLIGDDDATRIAATAASEQQGPTLVSVNRCGDPVWLQFRVRGTESQIEASVEDVTPRVKAEVALARLVDHDPITKALNPDPENPSYIVALNLLSRSPHWLTALHALHMTAGLGVVGWLGWQAWTRRRALRSPAYEVVALYWHLVDIVWVFLYPLFYLGGRS